MEITASEMKRSIEKIYERLDSVSPVDFDCGKLCGEVCCVYDAEDYRNEELALYLLPGEELMYEDSEDFELYYIDSSEIKYPIPHLDKKGEFHLIFDESEFPYKCPIVHDHIKLNDDFVNTTYEIWMMLIANPLVYDLVDMDSRMRDNRKVDYEIVI